MTSPMQAVPPVVAEALGDTSLPPFARLAMWHLASRLDVHEFREVKIISLAHEMRCKDVTGGEVVRRLIAEGYLDLHPKRKPRALRLPWTRRRPGDALRPDAPA